jgi:membrane protease YdiL (CAAX protease family)
MCEHASDLLRLFSTAVAGLLVIAGATLDLYFLFLLQRRKVTFFPAVDELRRRPFTPIHALQVVFVTLLMGVPALFQKPTDKPPAEAALICGPLLYAVASLFVVLYTLMLSRTTFRAAFHSDRISAKRAFGKGLLFGMAVLPPVLLLSQLVTACSEALGYGPSLQDVFGWFGDGSLSLPTRLFMMAAAVCLAPFAEEALFRGLLFPALLKGRSLAWAMLLTGFYFALVHFHGPSLLPLLALGAAFAAGYAATGSLLTPIAMHALFNLTSLLVYAASSRA